MAGELAYHDSILLHTLGYVKDGYADISCNAAVNSVLMENVIYKRGYGAFSLCAGDTDYLLAEALKEHLRLTGYIA